VQAYLDALNANLLRQVVLEIEVLQVSFSDEFSHGIDWQLMLGRLDQGNRLDLVTSAALAPLGGGAPAALSFVLGKSPSRGSPSEWVAKALQEFGRVSTAYSSVVTTTNRMPVPVGALQTRSYVQRSTAPTVNATTGLTTPGSLEPGKLTTGLGLTVLPVILDSHLVLLQTALQISELRQLRSFTSGSGSLAQSVQLPETMSFSTLQRISVPAGRTLVLAGFERQQTQLDDADLVRGLVPLARRGMRARQGTVVLITPRLVEP
jgi:type IVB pilus formation R64 PilN family outer membrane protein